MTRCLWENPNDARLVLQIFCSPIILLCIAGTCVTFYHFPILRLANLLWPNKTITPTQTHTPAGVVRERTNLCITGHGGSFGILWYDSPRTLRRRRGQAAGRFGVTCWKSGTRFYTPPAHRYPWRTHKQPTQNSAINHSPRCWYDLRRAIFCLETCPSKCSWIRCC